MSRGRVLYFIMGLGMMGSLHCCHASLALFIAYPELEKKIPYILLGNLPTPIQKLSVLGTQVAHNNLYIKREDLSGDLFGGNKIRKLEFLLADAINQGYKTVLAYGGIASNNVTSVAAYSHKLGLKSIALLMEQPITRNLKRNLLLDHYYECSLFECPHDRELTTNELTQFLQKKRLDEYPYVIPMGGSNKIGAIGWVNAAFELKEQIKQGLMPEPDYIYITLGSLGTTAGLLVGLKAAGLKTRLKAIQVTNPQKYSKEKLCTLIMQTNQFLHEADSTFPLFTWDLEELDVNTEYLGNGYACKTTEGEFARVFFEKFEHIILDETYTAKTAAALIHDCVHQVRDADEVLLYWHTYCADDFSEIMQKVDHAGLPLELRKYIR